MKTKIIYRYFAVLLIFTAFFAQTFNSAFIFADYYNNTSKYAENCVNKDKPMMHCNGKCQVIKKIQQEEKKDQENPQRKADNKNEIVLYSNSNFTSISNPVFIIISNDHILFNSTIQPNRYAADIFHPPLI